MKKQTRASRQSSMLFAAVVMTVACRYDAPIAPSDATIPSVGQVAAGVSMAPAALPESWTSYATAWAYFTLDAEHWLWVGGDRFFGAPGVSWARVLLFSCLLRDNATGDCLSVYGKTCYPVGAAVGSFELPVADDFTIDFHSLRTAKLSEWTYRCVPDATAVTASASWVGQGRHYVGGHGTQMFRESVTARGEFTIAGVPYSFGPTPQGNGSLQFVVYR